MVSYGYFCSAVLVRENDGIEEGILALHKAIELNPEDGWAMIFLANALARTGKYDEADGYYNTAIATFPDYPEFRKWYAEFLSAKEKASKEKGKEHEYADK